IKALLYQSKITLITQDEPKQDAEIYARLNPEIGQARPLEKRILESLLAGVLNEHLQDDRYQMDGRTALADSAEGDDFLTWTGKAIQGEIERLYESSLSEAGALQLEEVGDLGFLLDTALKYRELRPTLYDLLTHRAFEYYRAEN